MYDTPALDAGTDKGSEDDLKDWFSADGVQLRRSLYSEYKNLLGLEFRRGRSARVGVPDTLPIEYQIFYILDEM